MKKSKKILSVALALSLACPMMAACGSSSGDLIITASERGYGLEWLDAIVEKYEEKTGIDVAVIKKIGMSGQNAITTEIESLSGDTDIFFSTGTELFSGLYKGQIVAANGITYDRMFASLDSVYQTTVEGESKSIAQKTNAHVLNSYELDGHYYSTPWHHSLMGIVLNVDIFTTLGYTEADIPKTTEEMFALCDDILAKPAVGEGKNAKKVAPFIFSSINEYYTSFFPIWFAQYEGKTVYEDYYCEGKDPDGEVSEYVYTFEGQEKALDVLARLIKPIKKDGDVDYQHEKSDELEFTDMQGWFLADQAVFCVNGGWLDIEMSNYKGKNMKFIKTPVISSLVEKLSFYTGDVAQDDAKLRTLIDYVDEHPETNDFENMPTFASEADVKKVREARQMAYKGGSGGITLVPSWSDKIDLAKDFLTYMLSDEGLCEYYQATGGGILPTGLSDSNKSYPTVSMSTFRQNQMEIFSEGHLLRKDPSKARLYAIAGVSSTFNNGMAGVPGIVLREGNVTPKDIMQTNQQTVSSKWSTIEKLL